MCILLNRMIYLCCKHVKYNTFLHQIHFRSCSLVKISNFCAIVWQGGAVLLSSIGINREGQGLSSLQLLRPMPYRHNNKAIVEHVNPNVVQDQWWVANQYFQFIVPCPFWPHGVKKTWMQSCCTLEVDFSWAVMNLDRQSQTSRSLGLGTTSQSPTCRSFYWQRLLEAMCRLRENVLFERLSSEHKHPPFEKHIEPMNKDEKLQRRWLDIMKRRTRIMSLKNLACHSLCINVYLCQGVYVFLFTFIFTNFNTFLQISAQHTNVHILRQIWVQTLQHYTFILCFLLI